MGFIYLCLTSWTWVFSQSFAFRSTGGLGACSTGHMASVTQQKSHDHTDTHLCRSALIRGQLCFSLGWFEDLAINPFPLSGPSQPHYVWIDFGHSSLTLTLFRDAWCVFSSDISGNDKPLVWSVSWNVSTFVTYFLDSGLFMDMLSGTRMKESLNYAKAHEIYEY